MKDLLKLVKHAKKVLLEAEANPAINVDMIDYVNHDISNSISMCLGTLVAISIDLPNSKGISICGYKAKKQRKGGSLALMEVLELEDTYDTRMVSAATVSDLLINQGILYLSVSIPTHAVAAFNSANPPPMHTSYSSNPMATHDYLDKVIEFLEGHES